jgi:hypothetical protein
MLAKSSALQCYASEFGKLLRNIQRVVTGISLLEAHYLSRIIRNSNVVNYRCANSAHEGNLELQAYYQKLQL